MELVLSVRWRWRGVTMLFVREVALSVGELSLADAYLLGSGEWFALARAPRVAGNSLEEEGDDGGDDDADVVDGAEASEPCEVNAG